MSLFGRRSSLDTNSPYRLIPYLSGGEVGAPAHLGDLNVDDVMKGLVAGDFFSPQWSGDALAIDLRASRISRSLWQSEVCEGPFDGWLLRLAVEEAKDWDRGVRQYLQAIRQYRFAVDRAISEESDAKMVVLLVGSDSHAEEEKRVSATPPVIGMLVLPELDEEVLNRIHDNRSLADHEPRSSLPSGYFLDGSLSRFVRTSQTPHNGFIDPVVGSSNVLLVNLDTDDGQDFLEGLMMKVLRLAGVSGRMLESEILLSVADFRKRRHEALDNLKPQNGFGGLPNPETTRRVNELIDAPLADHNPTDFTLIIAGGGGGIGNEDAPGDEVWGDAERTKVEEMDPAETGSEASSSLSAKTGSLMGAGLGSGVFGAVAIQARAPSPVLQFVRK